MAGECGPEWRKIHLNLSGVRYFLEAEHQSPMLPNGIEFIMHAYVIYSFVNMPGQTEPFSRLAFHSFIIQMKSLENHVISVFY